MIRNVKPRVFSQEDFNQVAVASAGQTGKMSVPKSGDPVNYPVFEVPVNEKVLVYVPNITIDRGNGEEVNWSKGAFHTIISGNSYLEKRCYQGIVHDGLGYDGSCPFCNCSQENWELVNLEFAELCKQKGVSPEDGADALKDDRTNLIRKMAIGRPNIVLTYPIVVIECEPGTLKPKVDAQGQLSWKMYWYSIKEATYQKKWGKTLASIETEDDIPVTHPAGRLFALDFTYESTTGEHNKRDSANALAVSHRTIKTDMKPWLEIWDKVAEEGWLPQNCSQTVISHYWLDLDTAKEIADDCMKPTRDRLNMFHAVQSGVAENSQLNGATAGSAESIVGNFGGTEVNAPASAPQIPTGDVNLGAVAEGSAPQVDAGIPQVALGTQA